MTVRVHEAKPWIVTAEGSTDPAAIAAELYGVPVGELVTATRLIDVPGLGIRAGEAYAVHPELLRSHHRSVFERLMQQRLEGDVEQVKRILLQVRIGAADESTLMGTVRWWTQARDLRTTGGRTWFDAFLARLHQDSWYRHYGLWRGRSRPYYDLLLEEVEERAGELIALVAQNSREFGAYRPMWAVEDAGEVNTQLVLGTANRILDELAGFTGSGGSRIITDALIGLPAPERAEVLRTIMSRYDETDWTGIFGRYGEAWEGGMLYFLFEDLTSADRRRLGAAFKESNVLPAEVVDALVAGRGWGGKYLPFTTRKAQEAAEYWADITVRSEGLEKVGAGTMLAFASLWQPETAGATVSVLTGARLFPAVGGLHPTIGRGLAVTGAGLTSYTMTTALLQAATGTDVTGRQLSATERWSQVLLAASSALLLGAGLAAARAAVPRAPPPAGAAALARGGPGAPAPGAGAGGAGPGAPRIEFRIVGENPRTGTITAVGRNLQTGDTAIAQINRYTGNGSAMNPRTGEVLPIVAGRLQPPAGLLPGGAAPGPPAAAPLAPAAGAAPAAMPTTVVPPALPPPAGATYFGHAVPPATGMPLRTAAAAGVEAMGSGLVDVPAGRLGFQTHGRAPSMRASLGVTGADLESAHVVPQAVGRQIPGYTPGRALTVLLPRPAHQAFDRGWVPEWNAAVASGQTMTAWEVRDMLVRAINGIPHEHLPPPAKATLAWRLELELFGELGVTPTTQILP